MSDPTLLCVTRCEPHAREFIERMRATGLPLVIALDDCEIRDWMLGVEKIVHVTSGGYIESVLDEAVAACPDGYILRLDDDEAMSPGMVEWLKAGAYREADHWAFKRANLAPHDPGDYIVNAPLWPDLQTRLSVKAKSAERPGVHDGSPYGTGQVAPDDCLIEHHKFPCRSRAEREALVRRYDEISPGSGEQYVMFSVPELYADELRYARLPYLPAKVQLPHVDLMVCTACNLKCVGCTNGMGVVPMEIWPVEQILADARAATRVMHAETVCLLGGEPTAHPKLVQIMRAVREIALGDRIQVLTNGMRLHRMGEDFWAELEWLKVSIYPGKTQPENVELAKAKAKQHGFDLDFYDVAADPFRAVLTDRARDPQSTQQVYDDCWYRTFTRKIEQGYFYRCCTSPSISKTVLGLAPDVDGIALDGLTPDALTAFLDRKTPAKSCERCYGNLGPRLHTWSEERGGKQAWLDASTVPLPMAPA